MLMTLVALALVLSLVAALAPGASAQDSGAAPEGAARWMRYNIPSAQEMEAAVNANQLNGINMPKNCCITVEHGCHMITTSVDNPEPVSATKTAMPYQERPRWFCMESNNGYYP